MLIFSQQPTSHSRLGNSLMWMLKMDAFMRLNNLQGCFPWGAENFDNYFPASSYWLSCSRSVKDWFEVTFGENISANVLHRHSRLFQDAYEKSNGLNPFEWEIMIAKSKKYSYLAGRVNFCSNEVIDILRSEDFVICHEPFDYIFPEDLNLDYNSIAPDVRLFNKERNFLIEQSGGRPSVGLHIRRGDYKYWRSGSYYYSDEFWFDVVLKKINSGYCPWIFTNDSDEVFLNKLKSLGAVVLHADFHLEFLRFMGVNQIIGPPSTFSLMATNIARKAFGQQIDYINLPANEGVANWIKSHFS